MNYFNDEQPLKALAEILTARLGIATSSSFPVYLDNTPHLSIAKSPLYPLITTLTSLLSILESKNDDMIAYMGKNADGTFSDKNTTCPNNTHIPPVYILKT